jgi:hypothetical protein
MPDLTEHTPKSTGLNPAPPGLQRISRNEVTSCSHWVLEGSLSVLVGEARRDEPGREGGCNIGLNKVGDCNLLSKARFFFA